MYDHRFEERPVVSSALDELRLIDIHVDAVLVGGRSGHAGDDPLGPLLGVSNMGGFRYLGKQSAMRLLVITTGGADADWPDSLDRETGIFTYYGDNKKPGAPLHETPRRGNEILRQLYTSPMSSEEDRSSIPPIFVFRAAGEWRDAVFLGVAVPALHTEGTDGALVAIWRTRANQRFQNYRAKFTILDIPEVKREWIDDIRAGKHNSGNAPEAWLSWVRTGVLNPLVAPLTERHRSRNAQLPTDRESVSALAAIREHFKTNPFDFERFAADLVHLILPDVASIDVTRPHRDGGRDAIGQLRIGAAASSILIEFAMEAKCYGEKNGVGVRHISRLISRLRHRQFGILITTSYLDSQAYKEILEDGHPIIVVSGVDIIDALRNSGTHDLDRLKEWLRTKYPLAVS